MSKLNVWNFKPEDVWKVSRALVEDCINLDVSYGGRNSYNECRYCSGKEYHQWMKEQTVVHDSGCPVLVARDLLVGAPDE